MTLLPGEKSNGAIASFGVDAMLNSYARLTGLILCFRAH